jgi:hypothetical protein
MKMHGCENQRRCLARRTLYQKGRAERNDDQLTRTAMAQRRIIDDAIAKTAAARRAPEKMKPAGDEADFGSMTGIDSRIPTTLEIMEQRRDRKTELSDG